MPRGGSRPGSGRKQGGTNAPKVPMMPAAPLPGTLTVAPGPPEWLARDAKCEWRRSAGQLAERGVLTSGDLAMLEAFCAAKGRLVAAERAIKRVGILVTGSKGSPIKNPACSVIAEASATVKALGAQLGLSPASRARVPAESGGQPPSDAAADNWSVILGGKS